MGPNIWLAGFGRWRLQGVRVPLFQGSRLHDPRFSEIDARAS